MELFGTIATVAAVVGAILNNHRLRFCFVMWLVSNSITALIHVLAGIWSLFVRDVIFLLLAVEGWWRWRQR